MRQQAILSIYQKTNATFSLENVREKKYILTITLDSTIISKQDLVKNYPWNTYLKSMRWNLALQKMSLKLGQPFVSFSPKTTCNISWQAFRTSRVKRSRSFCHLCDLFIIQLMQYPFRLCSLFKFIFWIWLTQFNR